MVKYRVLSLIPAHKYYSWTRFTHEMLAYALKMIMNIERS